MFKKTVLVGILLITVLILSGCGTYQKDCTESSTQKCYGKIVVEKAKSDGTCKGENQKNINDWCYAVGDSARCSQLNNVGDAKLTWESVHVPKYKVNVCYPTCSSNADCGSGYSCMTVKDSASKDIKVCSPACKTEGSTSECLPGLTTCQNLGFFLCMPNSDLSATGGSVTAVSKVSPTVTQTAQTQPSEKIIDTALPSGTQPSLSLKDELTVELELRPETPGTAFLPKGAGGFSAGSRYWVDVYLVSASRNTLATTLVKLKTTHKFIPFNDPKFKSVSGILPNPIIFDGTTSDVASLQFNVGSVDSVPIMPNARIYLGSVMGYGSSGNIAFTLDQNSLALYAKAGDAKYNLKMGTVKTITPGACSYSILDLCVGKCGVIDNGCGGVVDCVAAGAVNKCQNGEACINNACVPAVNQVLSVSAPQYDKAVLEQISNTLSDTNLSKLQKLSAIVNAVKAWLAAQ